MILLRCLGHLAHPLHDRLVADGALLQRVEVVLLAVRLALDCVEAAAGEAHAACHTRETVEVVRLRQRRTARLVAVDRVVARGADVCKE